MILTGQNRSSRRETCYNDTLCTTNLTRNNLGSNPGPCTAMPATDRLLLQTAAVAVSCYRSATLRPVHWLIFTDVSEESCAPVEVTFPAPTL